MSPFTATPPTAQKRRRNLEESSIFGEAVDGISSVETADPVLDWKINQWYKTQSPETPSGQNTGYIIGGDGGGTQVRPYLMQSVDFINDSSTDAGGKVAVIHYRPV